MGHSSLVLACVLGALCTVTAAFAQHDHGDHVTVGPVSAPEQAADSAVEVRAADPEQDEHTGMDHGAHEGHAEGHADILGLPHGRHASGTAWLPDSTPAYSWMDEAGGWTRMFHGAAHLSYIEMNGLRGDSGLYSQNWAMVRATRPDGCAGEWTLSGMFSLDPLTVGGAGYPLLFQTGETWKGAPLVDHQHPHNYFMDLSVKYRRLINCDSAAFIYLAPVGEPALGPPAFMHRTFALDFPLSPLGHHWQDSTHIAYGVATLGVQSREWQFEASSFNGREPGEDRAAIESPTFDSYSGRVTWNPGKNLSLQASRGWLHEPEELHPGDVTRTTASATYNHDLGCSRNWQTTFVWGRNEHEEHRSDSWLVESALKQDGSWSPFFRFEQVEKSGEELELPDGFDPEEEHTVRQGTVGLSYDLNDEGPLLWGLGGSYTFNLSPAALDPVYGSNPDGWMLFLRVHPNRMSHDAGGHAGHDGDGESAHGAASGEEHAGHAADPAQQDPAVPPDGGHHPAPESEPQEEPLPAEPHHGH